MRISSNIITYFKFSTSEFTKICHFEIAKQKKSPQTPPPLAPRPPNLELALTPLTYGHLCSSNSSACMACYATALVKMRRHLIINIACQKCRGGICLLWLLQVSPPISVLFYAIAPAPGRAQQLFSGADVPSVMLCIGYTLPRARMHVPAIQNWYKLPCWLAPSVPAVWNALPSIKCSTVWRHDVDF